MKNTSSYRAEELMKKLSLKEKIRQISCQMEYPIREDYEQKRKYNLGNYRNLGHFLHESKGKPLPTYEIANAINNDIKRCMESNPHSIPPIEHGEALHGAQWGMATCFPQPIAMASMFDKEMVEEIADVIGKECAVVGVRQALTPVVNVVRDCRWGRTVETFGEDVLLNSDMGTAICKGLQKNGVIATPKHYADNYSYGGRDSNVSDTSERTMREVYLKPFEKCIKEGGALSVMAAYNSWDGIPCTCNKFLLTDILRGEWNFEGFVVSDYGGVKGIAEAHRLFEDECKAQAESLKAGLDINFPKDSYDLLMNAYEKGYISEEDIDRALLRVLNAKFKIGLMDNPLVNEDEACRTVRCDAHKKLALEAARKSIVLLKNENILPLNKSKIKKLAIFGMGADVLPVGDNYSGPYKVKWTAEDVKTPLGYLSEYLEGAAEVIFSDDSKIEEIAPLCDAAIYFTSLIEGEGMDRSDIRLPGVRQTVQKDDNAIIVGKTEFSVNTNQEESIKKMIRSNPHSAVVLLNGSPIDMSEWHDECNAIIEAWYPGEQGAQAICEILFGDICPSGKLPITIPRNIGQVPIFYSMKPSGRGYGYVENDGSPLYPFGYGLSYTSFDLSDFTYETDGKSINTKLKIKNMGNCDGAEVVQLYLTGKNCDVVRPIKELCAYKRVDVRKNDTQQISLIIPEEAFFYLDRNMVYDMHDGDYTVTVGTSSVDTIDTAEIKVRDKQIFITD